MACFFPLPARRVSGGGIEFLQRGERRFNNNKSATLQIPCGQCVGCRLERSRQWATRCMHESQMHTHNCFITLTYSRDVMPDTGSLNYRDFQLFMKRLRKSQPNTNIRFYMCGEYGEDFGRPHFHACLFGYDFPDKVPVRFLSQSKIFRSALLERLWPYGYSSVGAVTFESAAYVARYIMKKVTGDAASSHYQVIDEDGVITCREPEFCHMSLKPGIGALWMDKFKDDVYPSDAVVVRGVPCKPPRYYDKRLGVGDEVMLENVKIRRKLSGMEHHADNTDDRLAVRDHVAHSRVQSLKRSI